MRYLFIVLVTVCTACSANEPPQQPWQRLKTSEGIEQVDQKRFDLCAAVHIASGGAGLYEVLEIRQDPKADPDHIHIELNNLETWTTLAPQQVILRMPKNDPERSVVLREDEVIAILLLPPMKTNDGFHATLPEFVYRYDAKEKRVFGATLEPEGYPVIGLARRIAEIEGKLSRPYEAERNWTTLWTTPPLPKDDECS